MEAMNLMAADGYLDPEGRGRIAGVEIAQLGLVMVDLKMLC